MYKPLFLILLLSSTIYPLPCDKQIALMKEKEAYELKLKKEADDQAYRMEQLKIISALSLTIIAALVQIYASNMSK